MITDRFNSKDIDDVIRAAEKRIALVSGMEVHLSIREVLDYDFHNEVAKVICDYFHTTWIEIRSQKRSYHLVLARQCFIYLCYMPFQEGCTSQDIANILFLDHSTVLYHHKKVKDMLAVKDAKLTKSLNDIKKLIKQSHDEKYEHR